MPKPLHPIAADIKLMVCNDHRIHLTLLDDDGKEIGEFVFTDPHEGSSFTIMFATCMLQAFGDDRGTETLQ